MAIVGHWVAWRPARHPRGCLGRAAAEEAGRELDRQRDLVSDSQRHEIKLLVSSKGVSRL